LFNHFDALGSEDKEGMIPVELHEGLGPLGMAQEGSKEVDFCANIQEVTIGFIDGDGSRVGAS